MSCECYSLYEQIWYFEQIFWFLDILVFKMSSSGSDHYKVLGLNEKASQEDVRKA